MQIGEDDGLLQIISPNQSCWIVVLHILVKIPTVQIVTSNSTGPTCYRLDVPEHDYQLVTRWLQNPSTTVQTDLHDLLLVVARYGSQNPSTTVQTDLHDLLLVVARYGSQIEFDRYWNMVLDHWNSLRSEVHSLHMEFDQFRLTSIDTQNTASQYIRMLADGLKMSRSDQWEDTDPESINTESDDGVP